MGNILIPSAGNWNWDKDKAENCNIYANYRRNRNGTGSFFGTAISGYEGIPQNFVLNLLGWFTLNVFYIILRKKAWNYGRMAVMQKNEMKWTDMFYGGGEEEDDTSVDAAGRQEDINRTSFTPPELPRVTTVSDIPIFEDKEINQKAVAELKDRQSVLAYSNLKLTKISEIMDSGYFTWIKIVFTLTDQQYRDKCGPDCVYFLSFQRHLIMLALIITLCSLGIVLPINMQKTFESNDPNRTAEFSDTSIINLEDRHNFLWAHVLLAIAFLFISIAIMRHYSKELQFIDEDSSDISRTVMIIGINRKRCEDDLMRAHILDLYPEAEICEITFAYDISKLQSLEFKRLTATSAKIYCQDWMEHKNGRPRIRPYRFGVIGCCCESCGCKETDAIKYYAMNERKYEQEVEVERANAVNHPLGIAFVTFDSLTSAERIVEDYAFTSRLFLHTPKSRFSKDLQSQQWIVKYAPLPEHINWANLTLDYKMWYVKFFAINMTLAVIVIIFTTPVFLFTMLAAPALNATALNGSRPGSGGGATGGGTAADKLPVLAGVIIDTLPTMLIWVIGISLIALVSESDILIGFWTKTAGNLSEMCKVFLFLTFMVIILPSLGVTSLSYILHSNRVLRWSCIFYKENGALFVNYVCTSSLVGTAAELMRLPELFVYAVRLCFARSTAEIGSIRKSVLWEFQIGSQYAWMMLHFAIMTCFSVIYPLVTPFGLAYLVLKHWVDRYNIYFAYAPCKVEKGVHGTAVNFVIMCMFMLQINLLAFVHWHIGVNKNDQLAPINPEIRALQVFSLIGFSVTAALFLGQICFNVCADFSPIQHFKSISTIDQEKLKEAGLEQVLDTESGIKLESDVEGNIPRQLIPAIRVSGDQEDLQVGAEKVHSFSDISNYSERPHGRYVPPLLHQLFHRMGHHRNTSDSDKQQEVTPGAKNFHKNEDT